EQSARGQKHLMREFKLMHTRAVDVLEILNTILGIKSKNAPAAPMTPEQMQQAQQAAMMAQQQAAQRGGQPPGPAKPEPEIHLADNKRENSILAKAPADKMAIIEQAVKAVDIPQNKSQSLLANLPGMRVYHLSAVDPAALVKVLEDLGNLDPVTRLEVD